MTKPPPLLLKPSQRLPMELHNVTVCPPYSTSLIVTKETCGYVIESCGNDSDVIKSCAVLAMANIGTPGLVGLL